MSTLSKSPLSQMSSPAPAHASPAEAPSAEGSPHKAPLPRATRKAGSRRFLILVLLAALVVGGGLGWRFVWAGRTPEPFNGPTWSAAKERLILSIVERGALESAENSDIICRVK